MSGKSLKKSFTRNLRYSAVANFLNERIRS